MGDHNISEREADLAKIEAESPFPLTDIDRWVLSQTDEEFHLQTWEDLRVIIGEAYLFLYIGRYWMYLPRWKYAVAISLYISFFKISPTASSSPETAAENLRGVWRGKTYT